MREKSQLPATCLELDQGQGWHDLQSARAPVNLLAVLLREVSSLVVGGLSVNDRSSIVRNVLGTVGGDAKSR